jgi:HD-like signal output (HDOD) protein
MVYWILFMSVAPIVKFAAKSFTLPSTCVRLRSMLDDPTSGISDLAKVMSLDPSLSAKVLKLANSALFRFPSEVCSVQKALHVIGGEAAYNISMAETANLAFKSFNTSLIDFDQFWHKAVLIGLIAKTLAQQKQMRGSERFFAMGILQNLSELVCANHLPEKYANYLELEKQKIALQAQKDIFGATFINCSGMILSTWLLPEILWAPLLELDDINAELSQDASILLMANLMATLEQGSAILDNPLIPKSLLDEIGLSSDDYDIIYEFATAESLKIASSLK